MKYEKPSILTVDSSSIVECMGPAVAQGSATAEPVTNLLQPRGTVSPYSGPLKRELSH